MSKQAIVVASVLIAVNAAAQGTLLDGQTMSVTHTQGFPPNVTVVTGPVQSVVGPGIEVTAFGYQGFMDIDYSDRSILITARANQSFGTTSILTFGDASGTIPDFVTAEFDPSSDWAGVGSAAMIVTPDSIGLFFAPGNAQAGQHLLLTLNPITEPSAVVCVPGAAGVPDCPCAPPFFVPEPQSAAGHGCANSRFAGGAELAAFGLAVIGPPPGGAQLKLAVTNVPDVLTIFMQGDTFAPDAGLFGDGVRCIGGNLIRFGDQIASGGRARYPGSGQPAISVLSGATHGSTRWYQAIYRNASSTWCSPATFNATNGIEIFWH